MPKFKDLSNMNSTKQGINSSVTNCKFNFDNTTLNILNKDYKDLD